VHVKLRPVKISDESILKDFFYSLSDKSIYRRFISSRKDMPHERLQEFVIIDYTRELVILAMVERGGQEVLAGWGSTASTRSRTRGGRVRGPRRLPGQGLGTELLQYLTVLARKQGLLGFTAEVLVEKVDDAPVREDGVRHRSTDGHQRGRAANDVQRVAR